MIRKLGSEWNETHTGAAFAAADEATVEGIEEWREGDLQQVWADDYEIR